MKTGCFYTMTLAALLAGCAAESPESRYHQPLVSAGSKFARLPPTVQNSVRAQTGTAEISDIAKSTGPGPVVYEIRFVNPTLYPTMYVAPDGSVLTSNLNVAVGASEGSIATSAGSALSGLRLADLPAAVVNTIRAKAPTGEVDRITKVTSENEVLYEITFRDPRTPKLFIAENGSLVNERL